MVDPHRTWYGLGARLTGRPIGPFGPGERVWSCEGTGEWDRFDESLKLVLEFLLRLDFFSNPVQALHVVSNDAVSLECSGAFTLLSTTLWVDWE